MELCLQCYIDQVIPAIPSEDTRYIVVIKDCKDTL